MKSIAIRDKTLATVRNVNIENMIEKASLLDERLDLLHDTLHAELENTDRSRFLNEWMEAAAQGDITTFEKRLNWDSITPEKVEAFLSKIGDRSEHALP